MSYILIVDDDKGVRESLGRVLSKQGYEIGFAGDGLEALESIKKRKPNVMLLDIKMPNMDGMEVLRHVRADENLKSLPIIMTTAYANEKEEAMLTGADDFLSKPVDIYDVMIRVKCALKTAFLSDEVEKTKAYLDEIRKTKNFERGG